MNSPKLTSSKTGSSRVFLADPVCVLPFGHNATGINTFTHHLKKNFEEVIPLVCKELPREIPMPPKTEYLFSYFYEDVMKIPQWKNHSATRIWLRETRKRYSNLYRKRFDKKTGIRLVTDTYKSLAAKEWCAIFKKYGVTKEDTIYFAGGDYYGIRGLLLALRKTNPVDWPKIHIYLINVMENACLNKGYSSHEIFSDLLGAGTLGRRIFISAEVECYATYLSNILQCEVATMSFPSVEQRMPLPIEKPFVVGVAGAGRPDKGYFRLLDIIKAYNKNYDASNIKFQIQAMNPIDGSYDKAYEKKLSKIANVELLKHRLTDEEILDQYRRAHILLLPYDPDIYAMRGSAIQSEAIAFGRHMIATKNTGFESTIKMLDNGITCETDDEFARAINAYTKQSVEELTQSGIKAQEKHGRVFESTLNTICKELTQS